ncbi:MAG TPA: hypothetical protein VEK07_05340 [Polyangiaceae bacterium]|nr:hypothetical protein [Polyangiaceae bacterium]
MPGGVHGGLLDGKTRPVDDDGHTLRDDTKLAPGPELRDAHVNPSARELDAIMTLVGVSHLDKAQMRRRTDVDDRPVGNEARAADCGPVKSSSSGPISVSLVPMEWMPDSHRPGRFGPGTVATIPFNGAGTSGQNNLITVGISPDSCRDTPAFNGASVTSIGVEVLPCYYSASVSATVPLAFLEQDEEVSMMGPMPMGHTFSDLVDSDHCEVDFRNYVVYDVWVLKSALPSSGWSVSIPYVHASPSKMASTYTVVPAPCPPLRCEGEGCSSGGECAGADCQDNQPDGFGGCAGEGCAGGGQCVGLLCDGGTSAQCVGEGCTDGGSMLWCSPVGSVCTDDSACCSASCAEGACSLPDSVPR